jgi:squalene-hopene/tetraprenyl-beta-curcumene cyclase
MVSYRLFLLSFVFLSMSCVAVGQNSTGTTPQEMNNAIAKATTFLRDYGQQPDGSFSPQRGPAITALVVKALVQNGTPARDPMVERGIEYILTFQQPDGGIYQQESAVANYETSIAMLALHACNASRQYQEVIYRAEQFLTAIQWDESEGNVPADPEYGGAGYGRHERPDLSNTAFLIDALQEIGTGSDNAAIQRALIFVSRSQNLEGVHNTLPFATKNPDGGFYYTPANGGESQAGKTATGGLRSYGSMTYAGLKSMIYAGVSSDDPRVLAAMNWLRRNYTFKENPGLGEAGLYYYLHTAAKALDALGNDEFIDVEGVSHEWRKDLTAVILSTQQDNGSWVNDNPRWLEGDAHLVTSYALLALSYSRASPGHEVD